MSQDVAAKYGVPFHRSPVGEANVVAIMQREKAVFGGEGNGGPIDPRVGYVRDSFVGMALILDSLAAEAATISQKVDQLPRYAICKHKVTLEPNRVAAALNALQQQMPDAVPDRMDGLRLDWPDRWVLVRASNTEPIVRAVAEAPTEKEAEELCRRVQSIISSAG
jgi:phosphomannomutase